jgi:hypothetical protein
MGETWPQLYAANASVIGGNPNLIYVGEMLHAGPATRAVTVHTSAPAPVTVSADAGSYGHPNYCGDGDRDGWDVSCSAQAAPAPASAPAPAPESPATPASSQTVAQGSYSGSGGFQSCVIARESGGNSQVTNASGHYGLYQFSASTWAAYGGNPGSFGNASVAQQNQVFANAMATPGGAANWSPYDGC